jgi:hypothetical protein
MGRRIPFPNSKKRKGMPRPPGIQGEVTKVDAYAPLKGISAPSTAGAANIALIIHGLEKGEVGRMKK